MSRSRRFLVPTLALCAGLAVAEDTTPAPTPVTPATTPASQPTMPTPTQETLTVTGEQARVLPHAATSGTANKGEIPYLENTRRVDVVTRDTWNDLGASNATDLWHLVPNAVAGERGVVTVRGFELGQGPQAGGQLFDGVRSSVYNLIPANLYNVERMEVIKGPAGVMYGQGQPGGMVNYVLEKPERTQRVSVGLNGDSYGERIGTIDATGTLAKTGAGDVLYRLNLSLEDSETFRRFETFRNISVAPALTWLPTETTTITLLTEFIDDERTGGRGYGIPIIQGDFYALPRDYTISNPDDRRHVRGMDAQLQIGQTFSEELRLDATLFGARSDYENFYHEGQRNATEDGAANPSYRRQFREQYSDTRTLGYDVHVTWEQRTPLSHRLLVGSDLTRIRDPQFPAITGYTTNPYDAATNPDGALPVDLDDPYGIPAGTSGYGVDSASDAHATVLNYGFYGDYRIGWQDRIFVDVGVRYDDFHEETDTTNLLTSAVTTTDQQDDDLSFNAGLVWRFVEQASLSYGYSEGFRPQGWTSVNNANGPFPPLEWGQHEIGLQAETPDKMLAAGVCVFRIEREHDLVPDPNINGASIDVGTTRSEGIEFTVRGVFPTGTSILGVYGYTDAYVHDTTQANLQDKNLGGVPKHTGSITLGQNLPNLPVRLTAGWRYVGTRPSHTDTANALYLELPMYQIIDVGIQYMQPMWSVRLGIANVLDEDGITVYRPPAHAANHTDPRTYSLSMSAWF